MEEKGVIVLASSGRQNIMKKKILNKKSKAAVKYS